jgi:putative endonuclease
LQAERFLHMDAVEAEKAGEANRRRGAWGEKAAAHYLRMRGWRIVARNVRPCRSDRRCEIDIIARTPDGGIVFVEVKTHLRRDDRSGRLARIDARKKRNLLRACASWVMRSRWHGNFRFDVIQVYGVESGAAAPEIDHVENVRMFPTKWRFW